MPYIFKLLQADMNTMVIFSGRSDIVRKETYQWLRKHDIRPDILIMREDGDFTPDVMLVDSTDDFFESAVVFQLAINCCAGC